MSESGDPTRWTQAGPSAPDGFAQLAREDDAQRPSDAQLARMMQGVAVQIGRPELTDAYRAHAQSVATGVSGALMAKLGVATVVLGVAAAAVWWPRAQPFERARVQAPASAAQTTAATERAGASEPTREPQPAPVPALEVRADANVAGARAQVPLPPAPRTGARKPAAVNASGDAVEELALLEQAQRVLREDPRRALSLAERHRARFTRGQLVQEREMLAIEALLRLGRERQGRRRAVAFEQRHPQSSHLPRLHDMVRASR